MALIRCIDKKLRAREQNPKVLQPILPERVKTCRIVKIFTSIFTFFFTPYPVVAKGLINAVITIDCPSLNIPKFS